MDMSKPIFNIALRNLLKQQISFKKMKNKKEITKMSEKTKFRIKSKNTKLETKIYFKE